MKKKLWKHLTAITLAVMMLALLAVPATAEQEAKYKLEQVVVLSRHNIRSPLSGSGSLLGDITPHQWFEWTSNPSELSLRGAMLETLMGQYFRLWLEKEGLFPENWKPEDGAVRFYANAKQRTLATARYFSAGLLPVAVVPIESHAEYDTMDPTFNPMLTFYNDQYAKDVVAQIAEAGGVAGLKGIHAGLLDAIKLLMDVTDMEESKAYQSGQFGDLLADETTINLEVGKEPGMTGPIKTATSVADALTFQFYEMADEKAAAFGHDLTRDDWRKIHSIVDTYTKMLFETPLIAVNAAHPLLQEIRSELTAEGRKFTFLCGHDSNVAGILSVLGTEEYTLPDTVEPMTPIGVKLVFERWSSEDGESYAKVRLVYQSTEQLRGIIPLSLDNPPMSFDIDLSGLERNADGYYRMDDVLARIQSAIDAYDTLVETYGGEDVQMDDAA
jgi:glucose-1-phosphatase